MLRRVVHATVHLETNLSRRRSGYLFVTMGRLTSAQTSPTVASTWESGLLPTSPKHGTTSLAILSFGFTNHTVRLGVLRAPQTPLIGQTIDRQSKVFEPTTIEIRFQHLHKVEEGSQDSQQTSFVPVIERQLSPEDGPGYIRSGSFFWLYSPDLIALTCPVSAGQGMTWWRARLQLRRTINF